MSDMLIINGLKFAKTEREFTESLFQRDGTCHGFYRATKSGIQLLDQHKKLRAFIVNQHAQEFIVTATRLENGKIWYSFALCTLEEQWLNLSGLGFAAMREIARDACKAITAPTPPPSAV